MTGSEVRKIVEEKLGHPIHKAVHFNTILAHELISNDATDEDWEDFLNELRKTEEAIKIIEEKFGRPIWKNVRINHEVVEKLLAADNDELWREFLNSIGMWPEDNEKACDVSRDQVANVFAGKVKELR